MMWSTITPSLGSPVPCTRSKLAVCLYNNSIYMLSGRSRNQLIRDFWQYNIAEHTWTELKSFGDGPSRLEDHTVVPWKGQLYVFGGEVGFASTGETPLWMYDTVTKVWRKKWKYNSIAQPQGCRGHTAVVFQGAMHIYGGYRDLKGSSSELWTFDFETEVWRLTTLGNSSDLPAGRHDHSAVVHDSAMWVYGGMTNLQERTDFWRWDFETKHWARVKCKGGPGELHGHTACKVFSSMLVFGGERARQPQDALWRFHFATETWEKLTVNGVLPGPRSRHCALVVPSVLLIPPAQRPKSIPCRLALNRSKDVRQRPISSPPISNPLEINRNGNSDHTFHVRDRTSSSKNGAFGSRQSDSYNQLNFRMLKERISNVSLLKPSYSTYSALSNSSDSVQEDEPDQLSEMQRNGKVCTVSQSTSLLQPGMRYCKRFNGDTISRDLMSVPNFQQLTAIAPARQAKTPQSGPSSSHYCLDEPLGDWQGISSSRDSSFHNFLQYYSLVPGMSGFDAAITDSEDSGIHGLKSVESSDSNTRCYWNKGLTGDENNVILPGMVEEDPVNTPTITPSYERTNTAKRSVSAYEDFSLIDLNSDSAETAFVDDFRSGSVKMTANCSEQTFSISQNYNDCPSSLKLDSTNFESHKNFATCLNDNDQTKRVAKNKRSASSNGFELSVFPHNVDQEAVDNRSYHQVERFGLGSFRPNENKNVDKTVVLRKSPKTSQSKLRHLNEEEDESPTSDLDDQSHPRHFSMLVFGGREESQQSCLSKPLVIWRCEVWR